MEIKNPIQLVLGIWLGLFFLFIPFPFATIPEIGTTLTKLFIPLTEIITGAADASVSETHSFSDSSHLYIQTLLLGLISSILARIIVRSDKTNVFLPWIRVTLAYVLAFFLIKYGIEKFTRLQFPQPPPNILHAPTGSLNKDILFWTLMGTSKTYAWFMGITEVLAGTLLLFRRTRYLGSLIAVGIFANVFAINLGFNITVKLLSLSLLVGAIYILAPAIVPVIKLLSGSENIKRATTDTIEIKPVLKRALKGTAVALILIECGLPLFQLNKIDYQFDPLINKTFSVTETVDSQITIAKTDIKRLHFHPQGFLVTESLENEFKSYPIKIPAGSGQFKLKNEESFITVERHGKEWLFFKNQNLIWRCRLMDNDSLPLLQDDLNWTVESMMPE